MSGKASRICRFTGAQACPCIGNTYKLLVIQFIIRIPHRLKERAEKGTILTNALKMNNVLIRIAHPFLEQLSHKYHETVHSAVQSDNSVIYLDKVESDSSIFIKELLIETPYGTFILVAHGVFSVFSCPFKFFAYLLLAKL